jgi:hypothetical protein
MQYIGATTKHAPGMRLGWPEATSPSLVHAASIRNPPSEARQECGERAGPAQDVPSFPLACSVTLASAAMPLSIGRTEGSQLPGQLPAESLSRSPRILSSACLATYL